MFNNSYNEFNKEMEMIDYFHSELNKEMEMIDYFHSELNKEMEMIDYFYNEFDKKYENEYNDFFGKMRTSDNCERTSDGRLYEYISEGMYIHPDDAPW